MEKEWMYGLYGNFIPKIWFVGLKFVSYSEKIMMLYSLLCVYNYMRDSLFWSKTWMPSGRVDTGEAIVADYLIF